MPKNVDPNPHATAYQVVSDFQESVTKYYSTINGSGYAYTSGYLGSIIVSLIAELPAKRRQQMLDQLNGQTKEFRDKYLIECLSSNDKV